MKEFFTTIRHQSAVRRLGTRDLYLRILYCHLLSFTRSEGGWRGTHRELAAQLEITPSQITKSLNRLIASGLVRKQGANAYVVVGAEDFASGSDGTTRGSDEAAGGSVGTTSASDGTPLCNPLSTHPTDDTDACTHPRDAPTAGDVSFPDFCQAYRARGGKITAQQHTDSYALWSGMSALKRQAVMAELTKPDGFWRPRPDWLLSDYQLPPPKNYNGSRAFSDAVRTIPLVSAAYNGTFGIYSLSDARNYGMTVKCGMNFHYDESVSDHPLLFPV